MEWEVILAILSSLDYHRYILVSRDLVYVFFLYPLTLIKSSNQTWANDLYWITSNPYNTVFVRNNIRNIILTLELQRLCFKSKKVLHNGPVTQVISVECFLGFLLENGLRWQLAFFVEDNNCIMIEAQTSEKSWPPWV